MTRYPLVRIWTLLLALAVAAPAFAKTDEEKQKIDPPADLKMPSPKPLSPEEALKAFKFGEEGFEIQLVAAEPEIEDPVCMAWDPAGRLWVCEMKGYMPTVDAEGEDQPTGNIVILEDEDGDGRMEKRTVFKEGIVLPRAIAFNKAGILYADFQKLYTMRINPDGSAGSWQVVDSKYSDNGGKNGNVEHQANGLLYGLDNAYYNAKSSRKYVYAASKGRFMRRETEKRGQWGITQDDDGHLLSNTNSAPVLYELFPPGATVRNENQAFNSGARGSVILKVSNKVFPIRPTPNMNRAYNGITVSHKDWKQKQATAVCGPVIYRGSQFPESFYNNVFIPEPAGHLLKRVVLGVDQNGKPTGRLAYEDKEFLATTDERCRFVNAYVGPDGCLYLVDMYRGLIQHKKYLSNYLKRQVLKHGLHKPIGMGRIYRVVYKGNPVPAKTPDLAKMSNEQLVALLGHKNQWQRHTAQRLLVERNDVEAVKPLEALALTSKNTQARIHALWTLDGMRDKDSAPSLTPKLLLAVGASDDPRLWRHVMRLSEQFAKEPQAKGLVRLMAKYAETPDWKTDLQLAFTAGTLAGIDTPGAYDVLLTVLQRRGGEAIIRQAVISGLQGKEAEMIARLGKSELPKDIANPLSKDLTGALVVAVENGNLSIGSLLKVVDTDQFAEKRDELLQDLAAQAIKQNRSEVISSLIDRLAHTDTTPLTQLVILSSMIDAAAERSSPAAVDGKPALFTRWQDNPPAELGKLIDELIALNAKMQDAIQFGEDLSEKPELKGKPDLYIAFVEEPPKPLAEIVAQFSEDKLLAFELAQFSEELLARLENGASVYGTQCAQCHGESGEGMKNGTGGPPLVRSEWVNGSPRVLAAIALVGLEGDIRVNGVLYSASTDDPERQIHPNMGPMRESISDDQDMADVLTYIRSSNFENTGEPVSVELVQEMRKLTEGRTSLYSPAEVLKKFGVLPPATITKVSWLSHSGRNLVITLVGVAVPLVLLLVGTIFGAQLPDPHAAG